MIHVPVILAIKVVAMVAGGAYIAHEKLIEDAKREGEEMLNASRHAYAQVMLEREQQHADEIKRLADLAYQQGRLHQYDELMRQFNEFQTKRQGLRLPDTFLPNE